MEQIYRVMLKSKIHRAVVTDADIHYEEASPSTAR